MGQEREKGRKRVGQESQREGCDRCLLTPSTTTLSPALCHQAGIFSVMPRRQALPLLGESVLVNRMSPTRGPLCPKKPVREGKGSDTVHRGP